MYMYVILGVLILSCLAVLWAIVVPTSEEKETEDREQLEWLANYNKNKRRED